MIGKHQPQNVEAHLESARIYANYKKPDSILKVINLLHDFSPKTPESLVLLARAQFLLNIYSDCQETLKGDFRQEKGFPGGGGPGSGALSLYGEV